MFNSPKHLPGLFASLCCRLPARAIRHPRLVLIVVAVVTLAAVPGMLRLKLRTDGQALVSPTAPEVVADRVVRNHFGIQDQLVVLIRSSNTNGIYHPATLHLVRELTTEFKQLPGIATAGVMSLATEPSFRLRPGTLIHQTMLEPVLETKVELDQLREDVRRIELYTGTLVSGDGQSTVILVGVPDHTDREVLRQHFANHQREKKRNGRNWRDRRAGSRVAVWHPDSRRPRCPRQPAGRQHAGRH